MKKVMLILTTLAYLNADAIEVSPTSLNFGDVLMGNSPTMSFTVTADLEQLVTITPPSFYEVDIIELEMAVGQSQEINVTFTPPSSGNWDAQVVLSGSIFGDATVNVYATGVNDISGSLSGTITADYSPYEISGDIWVDEENTLTINPGVVLQFNEGTKFDIYGTLIAQGNPNELISFEPFENAVWKGLEFHSEQENSYIQYVNIKQSDEDDLYFSDSFPDNSEFSQTYHYSSSSSYIDFTSEEYSSAENSIKFVAQCSNSNNGTIFKTIVKKNPIKKLVNSSDIFVSFKYKIKIEGDAGCNYGGTDGYFRGSVYNVNENWNPNQDDFNTVQADNFFNLYLESATSSDGWITATTNLSNTSYVNEEFYIGFRMMYDKNVSVYLDDIKIYQMTKGLKLNNSSLLNLENSSINGFTEGISNNSSELVINNSIITNSKDGIRSTGNSINFINNSILFNNQTDIVNYNPSFTFVENSVVISSYGTGVNTNDILLQNPQLNDDYTLSSTSPCIDAGIDNIVDECRPPGLGGTRSDIGMYGGASNCGAISESLGCMDPNASNYNPDATYDNDSCDYTNELASPIIDAVVDLPQDQGGYVGIQYQGSIYDYGQFGYDITHYSFWRELDVNPEEGSTIPNGEYYITNRDEYWEWIGEMPAQQFEAYGYTAQTLADSNDETGEFISTFLVVAHTDDDAVFFTSNPASGSSIDNLAPTTPDGLFGHYENGDIVIQWNQSDDPDILYYEIYKNDELLGVSQTNEYIDAGITNALIDYYIVAYDENYNTSNESEILFYTSDVLGDITQEFDVNILDIIVLIDVILDNYNGGTDIPEYIIESSDINNDEVVNILDITNLVNLIMALPL